MFTRKKPSHPKPVPCMPVLYNIIQSGFKLEVKRQFWTHIYDETEICWGRAVALTSASIPFLWPSYNDSIAKYMHTIKYSQSYSSFDTKKHSQYTVNIQLGIHHNNYNDTSDLQFFTNFQQMFNKIATTCVNFFHYYSEFAKSSH